MNRGPLAHESSALSTELQKPCYMEVEILKTNPQTLDQYWSTLVTLATCLTQYSVVLIVNDLFIHLLVLVIPQPSVTFLFRTKRRRAPGQLLFTP